jgi:hypothetical protein
MSCVKCGPSMIMSTNCAVCGGPLTGFDPTGAHPNTSEAMQFCQAAISENDDEQAELAAPRYGYTGRYDVAPAPLKDAAEEGNLAIIKVPCPSWSSPPSNCKPRSRISGRRRLSAKGRISMKHMSTRFPSHAAARFRPSLRRSRMCRLGLTALMISVTKGRAETVEFLLQSKAKVDQRADNGYSAVRRALFPDRPARDAK